MAIQCRLEILGVVGCKHTDACMANRALLPGIKETKEENFMWKEVFRNGFCTVFKLNSLSRLLPNGNPGA